MRTNLYPLLASLFFRRGTEGVASHELKPPQSPFEKGGGKSKLIFIKVFV